MPTVSARVLRAVEESRATFEPERRRIATAFLDAVDSGSREADLPTTVVLLDKLRDNARKFMETFPRGTQHMYATKANPLPEVMRGLFDAGITHFDVASGEEIENTRKLLGSKAVLYYMNPRKSDADLDVAFDNDVKGFVADSRKSLEKILSHPEFDPAHHAIVIRIALPKSDGAAVDLSGKFGADEALAAALLQRCAFARVADIGMSFHVGSQNIEPKDYARAIRLAGSIARESGVKLTTLDVGGGFPAFTPYAHQTEAAPDLSRYVAEIQEARMASGLTNTRLLTEPGRALVADAGITIARVIEVDEDKGTVSLNTGTFGGLYDGREEIGFRFASYAFNTHGAVDAAPRNMTVFGPTCDSADVMAGQWPMPANLADGDYVAFENTGAYGMPAFASAFNGMGRHQALVI